jgi:hypothetical protein
LRLWLYITLLILIVYGVKRYQNWRKMERWSEEEGIDVRAFHPSGEEDRPSPRKLPPHPAPARRPARTPPPDEPTRAPAPPGDTVH